MPDAPGLDPARPAPRGNPTPAAEVRSLFDRIAPIYDAMNAVMTLGLDARWRRSAARAAALGSGMTALDVACGSGALTGELARIVGTEGRVVGIDLSPAMLDRARRRPVPPGAARPRYEVGDALALPVPDGWADATTIAFGLRNVADYAACLRELARVTRPGGRVVILEISPPSSRLGRLLGATWFERVVPLLGRLAGGGAAYRYLPRSVRAYPEPEAIAELMRDAGLDPVRWQRLAPGLVSLHAGRRR